MDTGLIVEGLNKSRKNACDVERNSTITPVIPNEENFAHTSVRIETMSQGAMAGEIPISIIEHFGEDSEKRFSCETETAVKNAVKPDVICIFTTWNSGSSAVWTQLKISLLSVIRAIERHMARRLVHRNVGDEGLFHNTLRVTHSG
jgi:hypothetical protein